jgi:hypothetical protein
VLREWTRLPRVVVDGIAAALCLLLLVLGARAVIAVVVP